MFNVVMLNAVMLNVLMLNVIMLNVIMLNVIILNVIMLIVVVPFIDVAFSCGSTWLEGLYQEYLPCQLRSLCMAYCYKTFYFRNLKLFAKGKSVFPWQNLVY
jgi:hypothetical protein